MSFFLNNILNDYASRLFFSRDSTLDWGTNFGTLTSSVITNTSPILIRTVRLRLRGNGNAAPGLVRILDSDRSSRIGLSRSGTGERTGGYVNYDFLNPVFTSNNFYVQWINANSYQWYASVSSSGLYSFYVYVIKQDI